ncbi:MAG: hypothetical protein ACKVS6_14420 [Planctomycetota bacterium]
MNSPKLVVYRAGHPVEARHVRAYLQTRKIDGVEIEDHVFRARPMPGIASLQEAYDQSGYHILVPPARADEARTILEEAKQQNVSFAADPADLRGLY